MTGLTCDVRGCPRTADHVLEIEWGKVYLCCECSHGQGSPAIRRLVGGRCKVGHAA